MQTHFIEVTNNKRNWGKFLLMRLDHEEEAYRSVFTDRSLLREVGWNPRNIVVFDLQTKEGAAFVPGGYVKADLNKHAVWVCPMYEPFLEWLYKQDLTDLSKLPSQVDLTDAPFEWSGYRRPGEGRHASE